MLEDKEDKGISAPFCINCGTPAVYRKHFSNQETWIIYLKYGCCEECQLTQEKAE